MDYSYGSSVADNNKTIELMKLFRENIKKDISNTNDIIKLAEEKIANFNLNLNSLKDSTKELCTDFNDFTCKINNLGSVMNTLSIHIKKHKQQQQEQQKSVKQRGSTSTADSSEDDGSYTTDDDESNTEDIDDNHDNLLQTAVPADFQSDGIDTKLIDMLIENFYKIYNS